MNTGWVSIHRQIWDNYEIWDDKPFSKGQAWIDLILLANHKDNEAIIDKKLVIVKRGQHITSLRKLGARWGWSRTKISDFLNALQSMDMLKIESDTKKTVLTIANYNKYQDEHLKKRHRNDTEVTPKSTNNNDNNVNNISCHQSAKADADETEFEKNARKAAEYMAKKILVHTPNFPHLKNGNKKKTVERWAVDVEKLLRIDRVDFEEFKKVLQFSQTDEFWQKNILSGKKLREQYGQLLTRIQGYE